MLTQYYLFGRILCCITGCNRLIGLIPGHWKDFSQKQFSVYDMVSAYDSIKIRLEEANIGSDDCSTDGWLVQSSGASRQIVFVQSGKAIFALRSGTDHEMIVSVGKALDSYVRIGILYAVLLVLNRKRIGLHGVTLLCGNEIVILSAPSGTGKTTLSHLLEHYSDAIVINGDFALLTPTEEGVIFEPTPFCGTSGRCLNHLVKVNRVVFLEQSPVNQWYTLGGRESFRRFMDNVFVPSWDWNLQLLTQENIIKCISRLRVNAFYFAPGREAAELFLHSINSN